MVRPPQPITIPEAEEAAFTRALLENPRDRHARLVFADWLDDHGQQARARYLREVTLQKFLRRVARHAAWALFPEPTNNPPRVQRERDAEGGQRYSQGVETFWNFQPHPHSPRVKWWMVRLARGWRPSKRVRRLGYYAASEYFGVFIWEYRNVLLPILNQIGGPRRGE